MAREFNLRVVIRAVDRVTAPLQVINRQVSRLTAPYRRLGGRLSALVNASGLPRLGSAAMRVGSGIGRVTDAVGALAAKFTLLGGIALGAIGAIIHKTVEWGDSVAKNAQKTGLGTREFQRLAYAAKNVEVSTDALVGALTQLGRRAAEAMGGNKNLAMWFRRAGIELRGIDGRLRPTSDLFAELADVVAKMPAGGKRNAILNALLGKSYKDLIPLLAEGAEGLKRIGDEAERTGQVLDEAGIKKAQEFDDSMDRLKGRLFGVMLSLGSRLLPVVERLVVRLTDWIDRNKALIDTKFTEWVARLERSLPQIVAGVEAFASAMLGLGSAAKAAADFLGGWDRLLLAIAAVMAGPLLVAVGSLTASLVGLGAAFLGTPIGLFAAAIAATVAGVYALVKGIGYLMDNWGRFTSWVGSVTPDWLKRLFGGGASVNLSAPQGSPAGAALAARSTVSALRQMDAQTKVTLDFQRMPRGVRVTEEPGGTADLDMSMGYALAVP